MTLFSLLLGAVHAVPNAFHDGSCNSNALRLRMDASNSDRSIITNYRCLLDHSTRRFLVHQLTGFVDSRQIRWRKTMKSVLKADATQWHLSKVDAFNLIFIENILRFKSEGENLLVDSRPCWHHLQRAAAKSSKRFFERNL